MKKKTGYSKGQQIVPPNPQAVRIKDALQKVSGINPKLKPPRPKVGKPLPKAPPPAVAAKPKLPNPGVPLPKGPRPTGAPVRLSRAAKRGL